MGNTSRRAVRSRWRAEARRGQTLLELIAATTVIAIAVVPSLRLMGSAVESIDDIETANLLATLSASRLEEHMTASAVNWTAGAPGGTLTVEGDYRADGYPDVRFQVVRTDRTAAGGIPGELICVTSTVWEDANRNGRWDAEEARSVFATKLARNVAYARTAQGT